jgi:hypothetical protein
MPFTPFHFGPGAALKAVAPIHFSLSVFCYSQIVTDIESAFYLLRGEYPVHRLYHTYVGATLVGVFCAVTGRPLCQLALRAWRRWAPSGLTNVLGNSPAITWNSAFLSAFIGTYSHVAFDSIMHRDVRPLSPFSTANPMLHLVSLPMLHLLCLGLGGVGVLVCLIRRSP